MENVYEVMIDGEVVILRTLIDLDCIFVLIRKLNLN